MARASKLLALLVTLLMVVTVLSACGRSATDPNTPPKETDTSGTTPSTPKPAVGGELNLILEQDPDNFNPILSSTAYGSAIYGEVYANLFEFNEQWEPTPYVAESWEASDDGLTWTIKIKQGIKFHDGAELTAEDVAFTLNAIKDPDYMGPRDLSAVESIEATGKYTLVVKLPEPYAPILGDLNYGILERKLFENTPIAEMDKNPVTMEPVGAGPYKFVEYKRGQYVILERNEDWFFSKERNGAPFVQTLRFKVIPDSTTAVAALENGEIDLLNPPPSEVSRLLKDGAGKLVPYNYERNGWGFMTFNTTSPILSDKRVRQAMTYGLDRQSIIDGVMDGRAVVPAGPIPPVSWAFDDSIKPYPYDPDKARQLLDEAGWTMGAGGIREKDGKKLAITFYGTAGSSLIEGLAAIARKNWQDIGIDLDVQLMDFNAMMDNFVRPGKFDLSFSGMSLSLDPDQYDLWHSSMFAGFNRGRWANARNDELLVKGRRETDPDKRKAIYSDFQRNFAEEAPVILIYANKYTDFVSSRIKGGIVNFPGSGPTYVYRWWLEEK